MKSFIDRTSKPVLLQLAGVIACMVLLLVCLLWSADVQRLRSCLNHGTAERG